VCVYAVALNEEAHVRRWADAARDADLVVLVDTGSTDATVQTARDVGAVVHTIAVRPWRFDDARNAALSLVPADIDVCVVVDLDEVLADDWYEHVVDAFRRGATHMDAAVDTGNETYRAPRAHARFGYRWSRPCHETLDPVPGVPVVPALTSFGLRHLPDNTKPRHDYLPLLHVALAEVPDARNHFYLAREYSFHGMGERAAELYKKYLDLPDATWRDERSAAMIALARLEHEQAEMWLLRAAGEAPWRREPWVSLAMLYEFNDMWGSCLAAAERALAIVAPQTNYFAEAYAWGGLPLRLRDEARRRSMVADPPPE
jgi:hypothetical protein